MSIIYRLVSNLSFGEEIENEICTTVAMISTNRFSIYYCKYSHPSSK